jgi:ABC-type glycerol-3-phosphate transport system permease component
MMKITNLRTKIIIIISLAVLLVFYFFPIYWIFASSFKPIEEIMTANPRLFPEKPTLKHYIDLFNPEAIYGGLERGGKFLLFFVNNSLFVSVSTTLISIFLASMGGYALSRFKFRGSEIISRSMLLIYLMPGALLIIPIYEIIAKLNLLDTHISLVIVYVAFITPFGIWFLRSFFDTIPIELEEAALVDGASKLKAFSNILLPLAKPGILTIAVYAFVISWGEYLFTSILIFSDFKKTIAPGLAMYMGYQYIEWGSLLAGSVIVMLPVIILFIPLAKYFLRELMTGAVKF